MATLDHAHSLLRLARRDFDALVGMQASALFADAIYGFHAQQAVEKALKAWLTSRRRSYPFTDDLAGLLMRLEGAGVDVERFWPLERFSVYGILARYEEGDPDADTPLDRPAIVAEVAALLEHVAGLLDDPET
jgi:HEPN domain-containing protein